MTEAQLYPMLLHGFLALAAVVAVVLLFISAPYGRHLRDGWGPTMDKTLSWVVMEAPSALGFLACYLFGDRRASAVAIVLLVLWQLHYLHRAFVFPFLLRSTGKRVPVLIVLLALVFNLGNTYLNGRWVNSFGPGYSDAWLADPRFLIGTALFLLGFAVHVHSDHVLIALRAPGESGYRVPNRGLHALVASPNYLGEIVQWCGWAVATWSLPGLVFAVWTAANLVPRARTHRRWYRETFPGYPPERRALIPFVW